MSEALLLPLQKYSCTGKLILDSNEYDVEFEVSQLQNGRIIGNIKFSEINFKLVYDIFHSHSIFDLKGTDKEGTNISIEGCYLMSFHSGKDISSKFNARRVIINPENISVKPKNDLVVLFNLLNIDETFRVTVNTPIGKLLLRPIKEQKEILTTIKTLGVTGITHIANIFIKNPDTTIPLRKFHSDAIDVIEGFLNISRLADTCYHEWCSIGIYEKMSNSKNYELLLFQMSRPKIKPPSYRGITNPAHSSFFYDSAYKGYIVKEKELKEVYNITVALEWYIEANIASVLESAFLMLCTCLELIVDRYQAVEKTEFIIDQKTFETHLLPLLEDTARNKLKEISITPEQRSEIYMKLRGLNRRSLRAGIYSILKYLNIKYDDLFKDIGIIIKVRNILTHSGTYPNFKELSDVFDRLYVLLTRIFLAFIGYDHQYFDWILQEWVNFNDVIKK